MLLVFEELLLVVHPYGNWVRTKLREFISVRRMNSIRISDAGTSFEYVTAQHVPIALKSIIIHQIVRYDQKDGFCLTQLDRKV